jgi:hypothetical protein
MSYKSESGYLLEFLRGVALLWSFGQDRTTVNGLMRYGTWNMDLAREIPIDANV